jgi:hypothetical protein
MLILCRYHCCCRCRRCCCCLCCSCPFKVYCWVAIATLPPPPPPLHQPPRDCPDIAAVPPSVQLLRRSSLIPRPSSLVPHPVTYLRTLYVSTIVLLVLVPMYVKPTCREPTETTRHCWGLKWVTCDVGLATCRRHVSRYVIVAPKLPTPTSDIPS